MFSFLAKLKAETLVGLLIISGVGLVIYSAIRVTGLKDFKGEGNIIHAYFDDVAGLSPQTAVRIAGIKVGRIESISLDGNRAKVSMLIFSGFNSSRFKIYFKNPTLWAIMIPVEKTSKN